MSTETPIPDEGSRLLEWVRSPLVATMIGLTAGAVITLLAAYGPRESAPFAILACLISGTFLLSSAETANSYKSLASNVVTVLPAGRVLDLFPKGARIDRVEMVTSSAVSKALDEDLSRLCERFASVTLYHAVDTDIPRARRSLRRLPLLERGHISRLLWEENGQKRLALYSDDRDEWLILPPMTSVDVMSSSLQQHHATLEPRTTFTDYEWACKCLADEITAVLGIRSLASDGILVVRGTDKIRETQKTLTTSASRIWAIDQTKPSSWLKGDLWDMLVYNSAIANASEGAARRIFVLDEQTDDQDYHESLCQLLFIHNELGIEFGVVRPREIHAPLLPDQTLYGNAVLWEEADRSEGHFRASQNAIQNFVTSYEELWQRNNYEARRQGEQWLQRWVAAQSEDDLRLVNAWALLAVDDASAKSQTIDLRPNETNGTREPTNRSSASVRRER